VFQYQPLVSGRGDIEADRHRQNLQAAMVSATTQINQPRLFRSTSTLANSRLTIMCDSGSLLPPSEDKGQLRQEGTMVVVITAAAAVLTACIV
jgi:hypothetical protein